MFQVLQLRLRDDFIFITCLFTKHYLFVWGIEAVELIWLFCFQTSVVGILLLLTISYSRGFCHKGYFCSDGGLLTGGFMCCIGTDGRVPHTSTNRHRRSTGVNLMLRQWGWAPCQVRRPSLPPSLPPPPLLRWKVRRRRWWSVVQLSRQPHTELVACMSVLCLTTTTQRVLHGRTHGQPRRLTDADD